MRGATCAIFMMTFNLPEVTKKALRLPGTLGAGRATGSPSGYRREAGSKLDDFADLKRT